MPKAGEPVLDDLNKASAPAFAAGIGLLGSGLLSLDLEVGVKAAYTHSSARGTLRSV